MHNMRLLCLLVAIAQVARSQNSVDEAIENVFGRGNGSLLRDYEVLTKAPLESLGSVEKCGEGSDQGVHRCVPYYDCDPVNNVVNEVDPPENGFGLLDIRATRNTCDHYLDVCCRITQSQQNTTQRRTTTTPRPNRTRTTIPTNRRPAPNQSRRVIPASIGIASNKPCGVRNSNGIDFRITGNENDEAEYGEFPWMVALLEKGANQSGRFSFCGASLIAPNVVLTAAHCVVKYSPEEIKIRAGEWDAQTEKERLPYQERDVSRIVIHENYDRDVLYNDIALLILTSPVELTDNVDTICLPTQNQNLRSSNCVAGGWGKDAFGSEGQYQMILKKVELPLVDHAQCQNALRTTRLGKRFILHESFRCAGGEEGIDTCKGDGGGPLSCPISSSSGSERYIQTGIVAWGIECGYKDVPGVYTDVTKFRSWIDRQLDQENIDKSPYILRDAL